MNRRCSSVGVFLGTIQVLVTDFPVCHFFMQAGISPNITECFPVESWAANTKFSQVVFFSRTAILVLTAETKLD